MVDETYSENRVALFRVQGTSPNNMQAIQVDQVAGGDGTAGWTLCIEIESDDYVHESKHVYLPNLTKFRALADQLFRNPDHNKYVRRQVTKQASLLCVSYYPEACVREITIRACICYIPVSGADYILLLWLQLHSGFFTPCTSDPGLR
ncbi:hypothetical protein RIF29_14049 [Crotalaria pallida]|uniref:Uncharacterized protein n=1 Tax=Crotalaria pallida TaxID=3830 RepID=A0AAN9FJC5_CROPI